MFGCGFFLQSFKMWKPILAHMTIQKRGMGHPLLFKGNDQEHGDIETLFPVDTSFGDISLFA